MVKLCNKEKYLSENDDLARAAVIFAVAGFDRYFTAKFCDVLVTHLKSGKSIGPDLYKRIEAAGFGTEFALRLISETVENRQSRPFRKIRTIVQNSLSNHTTHRDSVIDELFKSLGLIDLSLNAEKRAKKKKLLTSVMALVDLRNEIAHEAHVKSDGTARNLSASTIEKRIRDMECFVSNCDEIIDSKFGKKPASSA